MNSNNPLKSLDHWEDDLLERYPEKKNLRKKLILEIILILKDKKQSVNFTD